MRESQSSRDKVFSRVQLRKSEMTANELIKKVPQPEQDRSANPEPSLSLKCPFPPCKRLRVWAGRRPDITGRCAWCATCDNFCIVDPTDQSAILALIDRNLF
jgi:hypothetical protein